MVTPEQRSRQTIDRLLTAAGWAVQDFKAADLHAARTVAIREFPLSSPLESQCLPTRGPV